jgi:hypothetical protein
VDVDAGKRWRIMTLWVLCGRLLLAKKYLLMKTATLQNLVMKSTGTQEVDLEHMDQGVNPPLISKPMTSNKKTGSNTGFLF